MDLNLGIEYEAFREEVAAFLAESWRPRTPGGDRLRQERAFRTLATQRGYLYRRYPRRYGGGEQPDDALKEQIIREELAKAGAPGEINSGGSKLLAPTLLSWGQDWQKERFLRAALHGEEIWCQGYSEPGAGSDLASIRTRAELDGDAWVINGQKIWTSNAAQADFMFALVRTEPDAPKHRGISYILLDMRAEGVTVRPLRQMTGESEFNEVFLDNVRTPADWIVGERGQGWQVSRTTLSFERAAVNPPPFIDALLQRLKDVARRRTRDGRPLIECTDIQQRIAEIEGYAMAHRYSVMRQVSMDSVGQDPGAAALCNKLVGTDIGQMIARLSQEMIGEEGLLMPAPGTSRENMDDVFWVMRSSSVAIAGGTSNIQRNIIAERALDLPREGKPA
ncbi:acyl-CoA dehydrogenase family protein [Sphingobium sp. Sx8-8]|uniref:acyl-CoA dehydrogenase family protein n=1 Tax=Sphingobium sp. Sx8-8 TaxID=2933617 RepID=UPI001F576E9E|nr:acyl-CoA dehydrogenase family protein [Sphingobium sp. Sx8-8]